METANLHKKETDSAHFLESPVDFSLVMGGPLYQLYLRTRLAREPLELLVRRMLSISALCWLPLLILSVACGYSIRGTVLPFLFDAEVHVRFLAVVPLLILAELIVHQRLVNVVKQFTQRNIVAAEEYEHFSEIINSTMRLRNSVLFEAVLLVFCFTIGDWVWREGVSFRGASWYAVNSASGPHLTPAGYCYEFFSLPIFRFLLFRWYFRLFLWYVFLWRTRALRLHLNFFHPDRAAGLGFLSASIFAFAPVLVAHTTFLAGFIGNRIWHAGAHLLDFKMEIAGSLLFLLLLILTPLTFFMTHLGQARRSASREYGILASHYVDAFRSKWIEHASGGSEPLLGTPDLQSLADLGNAFVSVTHMRVLPFDKESVIRLSGWLLVPLMPLILTVVPLREIVDWIIKLAF